MGAIYIDQDVVVDGDLVTARTGGHCHQFANKIIELLGQVRRADSEQRSASTTWPSRALIRWPTERFYTHALSASSELA